MSEQSYLSGPAEPAPIANVDAEAALLGALLLNNGMFEVAVEFVSPEDFYEPLHGRIFAAIQDSVSLNRVASPVTLRPIFADDPAMLDLGGPAYLATLTASNVAVVGTKDFARQIGDLAKTRRLFDQATEALAEMRDLSGGVNPAAHAARLEAIAFEAAATKAEQTNTFTLSQSIMRVHANVIEVQASGQPTGVVCADIPEIEKALGPLQRGHLTYLAARPGMGKSGMLCAIARSAGVGDLTKLEKDRRQYGVGVVSLEMGELDLGQRFAADLSLVIDEPILHAKIRDARLEERDLKVLAYCASVTEKSPVELVDASGVTLSKLFMHARRMKRSLEAKGHTLDLFAVDYLQLLHGDGRFENKNAEITQISQGLKRLAKELNCHVLALSQLSRAVEQREVKIPMLSDLRDSGSIEQDADNVGFLYREEYYLKAREPDKFAKARDWDEWKLAIDGCKDQLDLIVEKRRGGARTRVSTTYIKEYQAVRSRDFHQTHAGALFGNG